MSGSSAVCGFGAGLFFIGYFLFELPSNLILQRVGARLWIARIMLVWGVVSAGMMFVRSPTAFYVMRFLLGIAEAGFFPGILLYFTYWFPARERARVVALFATGALLAGIVGSPASGAILEHLDGCAALAGWQWLFLLEGLPSILLGGLVFWLLPDKPQQARWLRPAEQAWLQGQLERETVKPVFPGRHPLREAFASGRLWFLCLLYFLLNVGGYGYEFWLPTIIKGFSGQSNFVVGLINAVPYCAATVVMVAVGRRSDRTGERRWHLALAAIVSAAGFACSAMFQTPLPAMAALTLAFVGLKSTLGPFWALGTTFLSRTAAAGGIAWINSVGNLGGFVGPILVGLIRDATGSNVAALLVLGGVMLLMGVLAVRMSGEAQRSG